METNMISRINGNYLMYQGLFTIITTKTRYHISAQINIKHYQDFTTNMTSGNTHATMEWTTISTVEKEKVLEPT